jgi:F0F1-type ATP synthase assembly protein I
MAPKNVWAQVGRYAELAFFIPISLLIGYVIGYFLDRAFGTHFLYLVFLILGIVAGFLNLFRELDAESKRDAG